MTKSKVEEVLRVSPHSRAARAKPFFVEPFFSRYLVVRKEGIDAGPRRSSPD